MNMRFRGISVLTNTPPRFAQRAPGGAQITPMLEPMIDAAAEKLGIDRVEIRRLNAPGLVVGSTSNQRPTSTSALVREAIDKTKSCSTGTTRRSVAARRSGTKVTGVGVALAATPRARSASTA